MSVLLVLIIIIIIRKDRTTFDKEEFNHFSVRVTQKVNLHLTRSELSSNEYICSKAMYD